MMNGIFIKIMSKNNLIDENCDGCGTGIVPL